MCDNPRRARQDRGAHAEHLIQLLAMASGDDFDIKIPKEVQLMINDWEDELSGASNATGQTLVRRINYWVIKNFLIYLILRFFSQPLAPTPPMPPVPPLPLAP